MGDRWNEDTIPGMFLNRVDRYGDRELLLNKQDGKWLPTSWNETAASVRAISLGLIALGVEPKQHVTLLSYNRKEWLFIDLAIMSAGAVTVPIYASNIPKDVAYIIEHSESRITFVENMMQLDKIKETWAGLPKLEKVVLIEGDPGSDERIITLKQLEELGVGQEAQQFDRRVQTIDPEDLYTISYTSGTTGPPKGAMMSHRSMRAVNRGCLELIEFSEDDRVLSFLPLAHLMERFLHYTTIQAGIRINYAESIEKVPENLLEVRPNAFFSVPRLFEKVYGAILNKVAADPPLKQKIFAWARQVGKDFAVLDSEDKPIPLGLKIKHKLADKLVFAKIRDRLGGRVRHIGSGSAPISQEIAEFFYGAGLPLLEAYGLTETSAPATLSAPGRMRFGRVGKPIKDVEIKIAEDGEVMIRGANLFSGYFKREEATKEAMDGTWFHSGDVGFIDEDGFLAITDRKKDLIITAGGKNIAPQNIENLIKTDRYISQVVMIGDRKPYCVALLTLDMAEIHNWAQENGLGELTDEELVKHVKVRELIEGVLREKNSQITRFEQIKKFDILPVDFSQETGELTPTMKVKRKVVSQKYAERIEALYAG